jgi:hypothetical protein
MPPASQETGLGHTSQTGRAGARDRDAVGRDARARSLLTELYVYVLRDAPPDGEAAEVRAILRQALQDPKDKRIS